MVNRFVAGALAALALWSSPAGAIPVKYFGQDAPASPTYSLNPNGNAAAARARFLANLNPATISTLRFTGVPNESAPTSAQGTLRTFGTANFPTTTGRSVPLLVQATDAAYRTAERYGAYNTTAASGTGFLYAWGRVVENVPQGGVTLTYNPSGVTSGRTPVPVGAFGVYVTDTEGFGTITLTLTPFGGGAPVVLDYTGIINQGATFATPGDGQVSFVGFIDTETQYEKIQIGFSDYAGVQSSESFGFDDLTIGEAAQLLTTKEQATVTQAEIGNVPGWRLLSTPVGGVLPHDLALQNLVQGVAAGTNTPAQYPTADSNFYTAYRGGGRYDYVSAASTSTALEPGRGFWWYWYDQYFNPDNDAFGGGTSESVFLDDFALTAIGDRVTADVTRSFTDNTNGPSGGTTNPNPTGPGGEALPADDDFYMIGNPFADPFSVGAITVSGGSLQDCFFAWNPRRNTGEPPTDPDSELDGPGSYEVLSATLSGAQEYAATWQGLLAEVIPTTIGGGIDFTFDIDGVSGAQTPPFYGRTAASTEVALHLRLNGTTASGAEVRDEAAWVRLRDEATTGWDRYDASKPLPPVASYAVLAPMGTRAGRRQPQAVLSLPRQDAVVSLGLLANEDAEYVLSWGDFAAVPDGWTVMLEDRDTGDETALTPGGSYAFDSPATGWWERFSLRLTQTSVASEGDLAEPSVGRPYPNPTSGAASVPVVLAEAGAVTVTVFDVLGRTVARAETAGLAGRVSHAVTLPTASLAPGAYVLRVEAPGVSEALRLTVTR